MLYPFPAATALRSTLLTQPLSKDVPPIEELESLYAELKALKQRSQDRAKKAESDAKTVEESFRRMKDREKEKGKAREKMEAKEREREKERDREREREKGRERRGSSVSVTLTDGGSSSRRAGSTVSAMGDRADKIKKERDFTPSPSDITSIRQRLANSSANASSSSKVSYDKGSKEEKKKKKRKREDESDLEPESVHVKSVKAGAGTSAGSSHHLPIPSVSNAQGHASKASISLPKSFPASSSSSGNSSGGPIIKNLPDFTLPPSATVGPLLPLRPIVAPVQKHQSALAAAAAASATSSSDSSSESSTSTSPSQLPPGSISTRTAPSDPSSSSSHTITTHIPQPRHPHLPKYNPVLHGPPSSHPAHPLHPLDIHDDFSKLKQPAQLLVSTFYTSVEPWTRPIKEEDIGFLEWDGDVVEPFVMPKLGRWYESVWEDLDNHIPPPTESPKGNKNWDPHNTSFAAPAPKWDPSTLKDEDLLNEGKGHGPMTERLISALMPIEGVMASWKGVKAAEDAMEGRPGGSGAAASKREKIVSVEDLETRIRDTLKAYGVLGHRSASGDVPMDVNGMPDYSEKVDDPIATALRQAQAELRTVSAKNRARKLRLAAIARDRLGYQEYLEARDALDKNINLCYAKLQKRDSGTSKGRKKGKKDKDKERGDSVALSVNGISASVGGTPVPGINGADGEPPPPPCPAALGLGPDPETNHLVVTEQLRNLVETRRRWVDEVGSIFEEIEKKTPGRIYGIPQTSIYEGLEAEIEEILKQRLGAQGGPGKTVSPSVNGHSGVNGVGRMEGVVETGTAKRSEVGFKGKERSVRVDAMDVG